MACTSKVKSVYVTRIMQKGKDEQTMDDETRTHSHIFKTETKGKNVSCMDTERVGAGMKS